jgi:hypothetical protein
MMMTKTFRFYKDKQGWFIDLPCYPGPKANLAMVAGADTMLDFLSEDNNQVWLELSEKSFDDADGIFRLSRSTFGLGGADYIFPVYNGAAINHTLWLCPVTLFVFRKYPKAIYLKKHTNQPASKPSRLLYS